MKKNQSLLSTFKSVLWAFVGVQSNENRQQDFNQGSALHFIVIGILAVIVFIIGLMSIVSIVLD